MKLIQTLALAAVLASSNLAYSHTSCTVEGPAELFQYQDQILALTKTSKTPEDLQEKMKLPLQCLIETYKNSEDLLTKYIAGSCLQRLMGGPELPGFKKTANYKVIYNSLINQQLASGALLNKSEIANLALGKWHEYTDFCKGSVTEKMCSELLPTTERIKDQNELLGATSMLILKNAYHHFKGSTKKKIARQIERLYKETSINDPLKRRVIDQIYKDLHPENLIIIKGT